MILIGLGANVPGPWGSPQQTLERAILILNEAPLSLVKVSTIIASKPFGVTDQPDFVNAVARIKTALAPEALMARLHEIELLADRRRTVRWGPRTLDLDLLDYDGLILAGEGEADGHRTPLVLPHPGITERSFVLGPIAEILPEWKHPVIGLSARAMLQQIQ